MHCYSLNDFDCPPGLPVCVRDTYQDPVAAAHRHDYLEIALVRQGRGVHVQFSPEGERLESSIIKGDVFTVLDGECHSYRMCRDFRIYNLCIGWEYLEPLRDKLRLLEYYPTFFDGQRPFGINMLHLPPAGFMAIEELLKKLRHALLLTRTSRPLAVQLTLLELLYTIFDGGFKGWKNLPSRIDEQLFKAIAEMEEHPEQHFSIQAAARESSMSVSGYAHKFKTSVGVSPTEYCILLRLDNVRTRLEETDAPVAEIAEKCGFCDSNYLTRLFRKRYGMTPRDYRKVFRNR